MPHRPNPANPVNPSNPYQSGPNGPIVRRPPMPRPMPQPGLMGGQPWPNQAPMAPYAPGYQRPPMPQQRGYPPPGYYGQPPGLMGGMPPNQMRRPGPPPGYGGRPPMPPQRRRPMPIDSIGSVGSPVGNQGGIGTAAQNEAVANGFTGAALSMSPLGPLGPMAANAMLGTNFGRAPPGPLSLLQLMQNSMSTQDNGFGSITGGSGVPGAVANNPSGYVAGMENENVGGVDSGSVDSAIGAAMGMGDSIGAAAGMAAGEADGGGGGGGGGKIICAELHRQGRLEQHLYELDEAFGDELAESDPLALDGYQRWARPVVRVMQRSPCVSAIVAAVARPWIVEMAHEMGHGEGSRIGRLMMRLGLPLCRALAHTGPVAQFEG